MLLRYQSSPILPDCFKERFTDPVKIGQGRFCSVYKCFDKFIGKEVALRIYQPNVENGDLPKAQIEKEQISILMNLKCEHTIQIFEYLDFTSKTIPYTGIVMPFYKYGDLDSFIDKYFTRKGKRMNQLLICQIITQLCIAVNVAHQENLVHCDIKLENILVKSFDEENENYIEIVLTDFGEAVIAEKTVSTGMQGTEEFLPPEAYDKAFSTKIDYWSIGVVLFKLLFPNSTCSIKELCGKTNNVHKLHAITGKIDEYWRKQLKKQVEEEVQNHATDYSLLFFTLLIGFLEYSRENRLNSLNALELCSLLCCNVSIGNLTSMSLVQKQDKQLSDSVQLHYLLSSLPRDNFQKSIEMLFQQFNEKISSQNYVTSYMIGIILTMCIFKGDLCIWERADFDESPPDSRIEKLLSKLEDISQKIKRSNDKNNGHLYEQLHACYCLKRKEYKKAIQLFDNSLNSFYNLSSHKLKLMIMQQEEGKTLTLIDEYTKIINRFGVNDNLVAFCYAKRGVIKFELGQDKNEKLNGLKDVLHARELSPDSLALYFIIVQFYIALGEIGKAKEVYIQMTIRFKDKQESLNSFHFVASELSLALNDVESAIYHSEALLERYENSCPVLLFLATVYQRLRDDSLTLAYIEMALEVDPLCDLALQMKIGHLSKIHDFKAADEVKLMYKQLLEMKQLRGAQVPSDFLPLLPDQSPLPIILFVKPIELDEGGFDNKQMEIVKQKPLHHEPKKKNEEITRKIISSPPVGKLEIHQIENHDSVSPSEIGQSIEKPVKIVKIKLQGSKGGCIQIDIFKSDTELDQVLERLNTIVSKKNPKHIPRVSFITSNNNNEICFITSIHQLISIDETIIALTKEQEEEYW